MKLYTITFNLNLKFHFFSCVYKNCCREEKRIYLEIRLKLRLRFYLNLITVNRAGNRVLFKDRIE